MLPARLIFKARYATDQEMVMRDDSLSSGIGAGKVQNLSNAGI